MSTHDGPGEAQQDAVGRSSNASVKRVLVVDDNEASAVTLSWGLELAGHDVRTCFDGPSAIVAALDYKPDIILLDIGMPVMDGLEVCRKLRSMSTLADVTVVAQTGWGDAVMRNKTLEAGFNYHLTKPVHMDSLIQVINEI